MNRRKTQELLRPYSMITTFRSRALHATGLDAALRTKHRRRGSAPADNRGVHRSGFVPITQPDWRPDHYRKALWGCEAVLWFPTVKLLDYRNRQEQLDTEANPFAVLTQSHLKAQETRHDPAQRYTWKLRLIKSLYRRGYDKQDILELFRFIDWLLELPEGLEEQLWNELETYERGEVMPYVTSVERIGIKKGILIGEEKGIPQGEAQILRRQLTRRFGRTWIL